MRELTVSELSKVAKLFNLTTGQIISYNENIIPKEIVSEDKSIPIFKIIDKMLTTKKFKDFFNKNVAAL